jgi:hypothetical protein
VTVETHFVQGGDGPVLIGAGTATLTCSCGRTLIQGYAPAQFLAIGVQCGACQRVTMTPDLPAGVLPPDSVLIAAPSLTPRMTAMMVPADVAAVGQAEMGRLQALFQPARPDSLYHVSTALLDDTEAAFERHTGSRLPRNDVRSDDPFVGLRTHALGWAVGHLRVKLRSGAWTGMADAAAANAVTHVAGFLHFVATWSRHPLFPAMVATAADRGFSLHGLAPFAAAHCLIMMGNRIRFPVALGHPGWITGFTLIVDANPVGVHIDVFDRFEFPFGQKWDPAGLRAAVSDGLTATQGRINLRHPGLLVLSPGAALAGFDEAMIEAVKVSVQAHGRRNRGLMAVVPLVLRLQPLPDPHAVQFGYGFFPIANRHYRGTGLPQVGS